MRQLVNVSYVAQAEAKVEPGELERWEAELLTPPRGYGRRSRASFVTPQLDALMAPPGMGG